MDYTLIAMTIALLSSGLMAAAAMGYLNTHNPHRNERHTNKANTINNHAGEKYN